eukprot:3177312-Rhodomonas_salina.1
MGHAAEGSARHQETQLAGSDRGDEGGGDLHAQDARSDRAGGACGNILPPIARAISCADSRLHCPQVKVECPDVDFLVALTPMPPN